MDGTLSVLFLWHMHQPAYRVDDEPFLLPWTRLHAVKDYLGMASLLDEIDNFKCTFNFTPVLLEQLEEYAQGSMDYEWILAEKNTDELTEEEIRYLIERSFSGPVHTMIEPFPRYLDLYRKIGPESHLESSDKLLRASKRDLRDLIVLRMLAWFDPLRRKKDSFLSRLVQKERDYTDEEKTALIKYIKDLFEEIKTRYIALIQNGQIEISTSPYFHPILPLLLDSDSVKEALPHVELPLKFSFPEDARWHVKAGLKKSRSYFGVTPSGMWPSEGSVSEAAASLIRSFGVKWIATDEDILAKSAGIRFIRDNRGQVNHPDILYRPWSVETEHGTLTIFFRDHLLSDLIGFTYQNWDTEKAVDDFISRLTAIYQRMKSKPFQPCVTIILDGENAWEYYRDGGYPFLKALFSRLFHNPLFRLETFSNFLSSLPSEPVSIPRLFAGSWINGNFGIWIGHHEENKAWSLLHQTYRFLNLKKNMIDHVTFEKCARYIRKAQGSDWFWWYGDDHYSEDKPNFDMLFRTLLLRVYEQLNERPPDELNRTLLSESPRVFKLVHPRLLITPNIDGKPGGYFDWFGAGKIHYRQGFTTMHAASENIFDSFKFGFDLSYLYVRLDPGDGFNTFIEQNIIVSFFFYEPEEYEISIELSKISENGHNIICKVVPSGDKDHPLELSSVKCAYQDVLEVGIPFIILGVKRNDPVSFHIELKVGGIEMGRIPDLYEITFNVPTEDYDNLMWEV